MILSLAQQWFGIVCIVVLLWLWPGSTNPGRQID